MSQGSQRAIKIKHVTLNLVLNLFQYCFRVSNEEIPNQVRYDKEGDFFDEKKRRQKR